MWPQGWCGGCPSRRGERCRQDAREGWKRAEPKGCKVGDPRGRMPWILVYGVRAKNVHHRQESGRRQGSPERVRPASGAWPGDEGKTVSRPGRWRSRQRTAHGLVQKTPGRAGRENGKLWNARRARRATCHNGCSEQVLVAVAIPGSWASGRWHGPSMASPSTAHAACFCSTIQSAPIHGFCPAYPDGGLLRCIIRVLVNCPATKATQGLIWRNRLPIVWCMGSHSLRKSGADGGAACGGPERPVWPCIAGSGSGKKAGRGRPAPVLRLVFRRRAATAWATGPAAGSRRPASGCP